MQMEVRSEAQCVILLVGVSKGIRQVKLPTKTPYFEGQQANPSLPRRWLLNWCMVGGWRFGVAVTHWS